MNTTLLKGNFANQVPFKRNICCCFTSHLVRSSLTFSFSLTCVRSPRRQRIRSWASPSCRASFLPIPTPECSPTTRSSRRSVPGTTPSGTIHRGTSLFLTHSRRGKASASPSIPSSTCPCFSCTARCLCAPRGLTATRGYRRYAAVLLAGFYRFPCFLDFAGQAVGRLSLNKCVTQVVFV